MPSNKVLAKLRQMGRAVDSLTLQHQAYSRAAQTCREHRRLLKDRLQDIQASAEREQLQELAQRDPGKYGPALAQARATITQLEEQIGESETEEAGIREQATALREFSSPNARLFDDLLRHFGLSRVDLGVPYGNSAANDRTPAVQI